MSLPAISRHLKVLERAGLIARGRSAQSRPSSLRVETLREEARQSREGLGGYLADRTWMNRVLDQTHENVDKLAAWGYPFPTNDAGEQQKLSLQGPEYMRLMRKRVKLAGELTVPEKKNLEVAVRLEAGRPELPERVELYDFVNAMTASAKSSAPSRRLEIETLAGDILSRHARAA